MNAKESSFSARGNALAIVFFSIVILLAALPVLLVIASAFSSEESVAIYGYRFIPRELSLDAFRVMFKSGSTLPGAYLNSVLITFAGTALSLLVMCPCAYALSRKEFKHRRALMLYLMIPMLFTGGLVASYMVNAQLLRLKNTYWALILPGMCSTWYIMMLRNYFITTVPDALIESARMEGAGPLVTFLRVALPICTPVVMTVAIFQIFAYWNMWYPALLYIDTNHSELYPLQYVLVNIDRTIQAMSRDAAYVSGMSSYNLPSTTLRMAIVVVALAPIMLLFPFFQRYLKTGLTVGAVKG